MKKLLAAMMILLSVAGGCTTPTGKLAGWLADVQANASSADAAFKAIEDCAAEAKKKLPPDSPVVEDVTEIGEIAAGGRKNIGKIITAATQAQKELGNVENKATWFDKLMRALVWVAGAIVFVIVAVAFWYVARRYGWLIPKSTRRSAEMDRQILNGHADPREAIAARRAADPAYDRAFRQIPKLSRPPPAPPSGDSPSPPA